jgi:hypothetical protein
MLLKLLLLLFNTYSNTSFLETKEICKLTLKKSDVHVREAMIGDLMKRKR